MQGPAISTFIPSSLSGSFFPVFFSFFPIPFLPRLCRRFASVPILQLTPSCLPSRFFNTLFPPASVAVSRNLNTSSANDLVPWRSTNVQQPYRGAMAPRRCHDTIPWVEKLRTRVSADVNVLSSQSISFPKKRTGGREFSRVDR